MSPSVKENFIFRRNILYIPYWIISKDPEFDIIYTTRTDDIHGKMKSNEIFTILKL